MLNTKQTYGKRLYYQFNITALTFRQQGAMASINTITLRLHSSPEDLFKTLEWDIWAIKKTLADQPSITDKFMVNHQIFQAYMDAWYVITAIAYMFI